MMLNMLDEVINTVQLTSSIISKIGKKKKKKKIRHITSTCIDAVSAL